MLKDWKVSVEVLLRAFEELNGNEVVDLGEVEVEASQYGDGEASMVPDSMVVDPLVVLTDWEMELGEELQDSQLGS
jgi:hypothetical protein